MASYNHNPDYEELSSNRRPDIFVIYQNGNE